ncbi:hypothetical protein CALVIDRAFT_595159 [Calocera viscosa TUFC12733]|uniref:Mis12-Mtw1 protein family n=1 Tax=Calocera viscosa (strain TUFC12733) TaxID=1330018 RepID=A0A167QWW5_CALVF|nr:hypothetical protein CALVIDRAFT_595159 [Calocera viscosa TUFC12733]
MPPRRQPQWQEPVRSSSTSPSPIPAKRKATEEPDGVDLSKKKPKQAKGKGKVNGEQVAGGLFIVRGAPQVSTAPAAAPVVVPPPAQRRPARRSSPAPKEAKTVSHKTVPHAHNSRTGTSTSTAAKGGKGKANGRRRASDQDEDTEDYRAMEKELKDLTAAGRVASKRAGPSSPQTDLTFPRKSFALPPPPSPSAYRPAPVPSQEFLDASSSQDSMQPLPVRDTPMIHKNREMRRQTQERRRSSMGMRGRRTSGSAAEEASYPHASLPHDVFYKHIQYDAEVPPAARMRSLLQWCAYRAGQTVPAPSPTTRTSKRVKEKAGLVTQPDLPTLSGDAERLLKEVQDEVFRMVSTNQIDTNTFSKSKRPIGDGGKKLKANEQNERNREREAADQLYFQQCKQEEVAWTSLIQSYNTIQSTVLKSIQSHAERRKTESASDLNLAHLDEASRIAARAVAAELEEAGQGEDELNEKFAALQLKVDTLHQSAHVLSQLAQRADRHLSSHLVTLQSRHQTRTAPLPPLTAPSTLSSANPNAPLSGLLSAVRPDARDTTAGGQDDPQLLLKALASKDVERQRREEAGDNEAERRREGVADRRVTAVPPTPRRQPGTPGRRSTPGRGRA